MSGDVYFYCDYCRGLAPIDVAATGWTWDGVTLDGEFVVIGTQYCCYYCSEQARNAGRSGTARG